MGNTSVDGKFNNLVAENTIKVDHVLYKGQQYLTENFWLKATRIQFVNLTSKT